VQSFWRAHKRSPALNSRRGDGATEEFNPQRFRFAIESGYLFGTIRPQVTKSARVSDGRIRWELSATLACVANQFYVSAMAERFFAELRNHYFRFNLACYNFVRPSSRFVPFFGRRRRAGSTVMRKFPADRQDFTFNILSAAGISYSVNDHWKINVGALYQHLSNGGQTDPNPSLNLFGPQVGVTCSFKNDVPPTN
jgi:hypothetical protein